MADPNDISQIASRVERLLQRHHELRHAHAQLIAEVAALTDERELLRSRLSAARARIDALLDRLPDAATTPYTDTAP